MGPSCIFTANPVFRAHQWMYDSLAAGILEITVVRRFASILILLLAAPSARAQNICDSYQSNDNVTIFRGYVADVTVDQSTCIGQFCNEKMRVQPLEVFKGNLGLEITITQPNFSTGPPRMARGRGYLFCAQVPRANGDVYAGGTEIANVASETLAWLRAYPTAPQTVRVYGEFRNVPSTLDAHHILVTLTGTGVNNRSWNTTPDTKYAYSFPALGPAA